MWRIPISLALALALAGVALALGSPAGPATAATSSSVVVATVPSASSLDTTGCATGTTDVTAFAPLQPSTSSVTALDCAIVFGSSNDTSMLRMWQSDLYGAAMYRPPTGPLDPTFDADGTLTVNVGAAIDNSAALAVQPDGKLVVGVSGCSANCVSLVRLSEGGSLDTTFSVDGITNDEWSGLVDRVMALAIQPDGRIVAAGYANSSSGTVTDLAVARYQADGTLDTSFAGDGVQVVNINAGRDDAHELELQPDGKIVVVGATGDDSYVARFLADGTLDTTFDGDGLRVLSVAAGADAMGGLAIQPDGRIITCGWAHNGTNLDLAAARFTAAGALDTTWDGDGLRTDPVTPGDDQLTACDLQPDGRLVAAGMGRSGSGDLDFVLARYTAAGAPDATLDVDGFAQTVINPGANDQADQIAQQPDGKLVLIGRTAPSTGDIAVARYHRDGSLDTSFDGDGRLSVTVPGFTNEEAYQGAVVSDGRIVGVGAANSGGSWSMVAFRLASTTVADYTSAATDWDAGANAFGACLRAVTGTGVTGSWTVDADGSCTPTDTDPWYPVAATAAGASATITRSGTAGTTNATALLRFGFRTGASQELGDYLAPVTVEVLAPNA